MTLETDPRCPVSWLTLERHTLGELGADERSAVDVHLATCATCRARQARILADQRPLQPLREPARTRRWTRWAWVPVLAAAAVALAVFRSSDTPGLRAKGDSVVLTLVRERGGHVVEDARTFRRGDRFRVLLTCPPGTTVWDVVVLQGDAVDHPLDVREPIVCGSRVSVPGAFRLSGSETANVCAVDDEEVPTGCVPLDPEG